MKPVAKLQPVFILASNHAHPIFSISYGHAAVYCDSQQNRENVAAIYKTWRGTSDATHNTIKKVLSRDRSRDHKKRKRTRNSKLLTYHSQPKVSFLNILNFPNTILKSARYFRFDHLCDSNATKSQPANFQLGTHKNSGNRPGASKMPALNIQGLPFYSKRRQDKRTKTIRQRRSSTNVIYIHFGKRSTQEKQVEN